jgi:hypothetical protein
MYIISLDYHNKRKKKGTENDKYYFTHNNHAALFLSNPIGARTKEAFSCAYLLPGNP